MTAAGAVLTVSALAVGTGMGLDRLVRPELRSDQTATSGPASRPAVFDPTARPTRPARAGEAGGTGQRDVPDGAAPSAKVPPQATRAPARPPVQPSETTTPAAKDGPPPAGLPGTADAGLEATVMDLTNAERTKAGCKPLHPDARLATAAREHSADMAANGYFDHTSRDGHSPWKRMEDAGYPNPGAENIAKGYATAAAVVDGWMKSPGHRANILNCDLRAIGVGMATGPVGPVWTQDFGWK